LKIKKKKKLKLNKIKKFFRKFYNNKSIYWTINNKMKRKKPKWNKIKKFFKNFNNKKSTN